jgi:hypothetical protein
LRIEVKQLKLENQICFPAEYPPMLRLNEQLYALIRYLFKNDG